MRGFSVDAWMFWIVIPAQAGIALALACLRHQMTSFVVEVRFRPAPE
jgi:hypothetical protein